MAIITQFPKPLNVFRHFAGKIEKIVKGKKELRIYTRFGVTVKVLYFSLPTLGGLRIHNGNTGFFEVEDNYELKYEPIESGFTFYSDSEDIFVDFNITEESWNIVIRDSQKEIKKTVWAQEILLGFDVKEENCSVKFLSEFGEDELIYGLGERFNSVCQRGTEIPLWNFDCCHPPLSLMRGHHEKIQGYKNVPMIHSSTGYSVFFNNSNAGTANIGEWEPNQYFLEFAGNQFDIFIWIGTPKQNIKNYYTLTGLPFLPPRWAAEYWAGGGAPVWNCDGRENAIKKVRESYNGYKDMGIRVKNYYLEVKPAKEIFDFAKENNVNLLFWTDSVLRTEHKSLFSKNDINVRSKSNPEQFMPGDYVDFTNPNSRLYINDKYEESWETETLHGVMIDYADNVYEDSVFSNGKYGTEMHNAYPYWYAKRFNEAWQARMGNDFILFQRSGCAGSQHYAGSFGGDLPSSSIGLRRSLTAGISAANSGFTVWGSDIGGFTGPMPSEDLYIRWLQFATFSPLMRAHGLLPRDPWHFCDKAVNEFKRYYWLRYSIADTVYSSMIKANTEGETVLRSLAVEYNNDPAIADIDDEYIFCDNMLVCPIIDENCTERKIVFPKDTWYDFWNGSVYSEGTQTVCAPVETIPVYIRSGSAIPVITDKNGSLTSDMNEGEIKSLIVTPTDLRRTSYFYTENKERIEYTVSKASQGLQILCSQASNCQYIILYGNSATKVYADGKQIEKSDIRFDNDLNRTLINLNTEWKEILINY